MVGKKFVRKTALAVVFDCGISGYSEKFGKIDSAVYVALTEVDFRFIVKSEIVIMVLSECCHSFLFLIIRLYCAPF